MTAAQIVSEQAIYGGYLASFNSLRATVLQYYQYATGGGFTVIVYLWVIFGIGKAAAIATLVALIVIALLFLYLLDLRVKMAASQSRLAALILMYHRLQQIPTCQMTAGDGDDSEWFDWFFDSLEEEAMTPGG